MTLTHVRDPELVREVLRRVEDFPPTNALVAVTPLRPEALRVLGRAGFALPPVLASATGVRHRMVRQLVARFFTPAKVSGVRPLAERLTARRCAVAADLLRSGPVDLADSIGRHVPPGVMFDLMGLECPDLLELQRWSRDSLELFWGWPDAERQVALAVTAVKFFGWLRETVRREHGRSSLFGALAEGGLNDTEICALGYFLVIAGQETTAQLINIAFRRALERPEVWQAIARGASAAPFVRRILATESSVPTWRRAVPRDTWLADRRVPAGSELLLHLTGHHPTSADPTAFGLAFGYGVHRCLGARLAELEAIVVLEGTARAFPGLALHGSDVEWIELLSFRTPKRVTVAWGRP